MKSPNWDALHEADVLWTAAVAEVFTLSESQLSAALRAAIEGPQHRRVALKVIATSPRQLGATVIGPLVREFVDGDADVDLISGILPWLPREELLDEFARVLDNPEVKEDALIVGRVLWAGRIIGEPKFVHSVVASLAGVVDPDVQETRDAADDWLNVTDA